MASRGFEDLEVYRLSERLADDIWWLVLKWPRLAQDTVGKQLIRACDERIKLQVADRPIDTVGKQLIRACDSIGANIAEGSGKGIFADNKRYVRVARGSLCETRHWLRRAFRRQLLSEADTTRLRPMISELGPRLNAYLRSIGRMSEPKVEPPSIAEPPPTNDQ